ncbi:aryl-sulfate sulfotransferase [Frateuria aurantia]
MNTLKTLALSMTVLAFAGATGLAAAHPSVYPTGVTRYDPTRAWNGYVLFSAGDDVTYLIDMDGHVVHQWPHKGFPSVYIDPALVGGRRGEVLLTLQKQTPPKGYTAWGNGLANQSVGELDWNGRTVWQWGAQAPGGTAQQHHEILRLPDGNTLVLADRIRPVPGFIRSKVIDDVVYEVRPDGQVAWSWSALDHLEEFGFTAEQLKLVRHVEDPDVLHINNAKVIGDNPWYRHGDTRFKPGNLLIDSRNANFIAIVDRASGHVVWRMGPNLPTIDPKKASQVPRPVDQTIGQHDAQLIAEGLPGAGHLLVFDNQGEAGYPRASHAMTGGSRVLEIDPVKGEIVWQYTADRSQQPGWAFFSSFISSARRLPNGNTLIDEGMNGRVFQVTPEGDIVWEYVSPYFSRPSIEHKAPSNALYRAQPVPYDWAPAGTPHSEQAVTAPSLSQFHVAGS